MLHFSRPEERPRICQIVHHLKTSAEVDLGLDLRQRGAPPAARMSSFFSIRSNFASMVSRRPWPSNRSALVSSNRRSSMCAASSFTSSSSSSSVKLDRRSRIVSVRLRYCESLPLPEIGLPSTSVGTNLLRPIAILVAACRPVVRFLDRFPSSAQSSFTERSR